MSRHLLSEIPELSNLEAGRGLVRIPVEQDVPFTPRVRALVDTPEFQRLHHVTQLGLTSRVYPGATHTRFEHALGVFHNALKYLWQLAKDDRFTSVVDVHTAEVLMAAALLHDLGHWPFCHPIEDMDLDSVPHHEEFAAEFLAPHRELAQVLKNEWNIEADEVLDVLVPRTNSPRLRLVRSILSGPIDIDKMDYLDRDSLHCGVPYGRNFDRSRLMQSLVVNGSGDGLAITAKGRTAAELMVFARYVMFSEVYWHHAVRSATTMFARGFYDLHGQLDLRAFFQQSEFETIAALRAQARGTLSERLVEGVFGPKRRLDKRVLECSPFQQTDVYERLARKPFRTLVDISRRLAVELSRHTGTAVAETDILIDAPPPRPEVEFKVEIYYPKEGVFRPLAQVSPVVASLSKTRFDDSVKRVRIFAEPDLARRLKDTRVVAECVLRATGP
jgi:HD superfamily phosphohydrolase